jgi:rare lipoprotein A
MQKRAWTYAALFGSLFFATQSCYANNMKIRVINSGLATFYDPPWPGLTAAHRWLPFGTLLRVTNKTNGRSVVVRISDRGPQAWTGRVLDLSRAAARALGMERAGVVPISYVVQN